MIEIVLIFLFSWRIASIARSKGRGATGWVLLFIGMWVGGEISGFVLGAIAQAVLFEGEEPVAFLILLGGVAGAATGAVSAFAIVNSLPPLRPVDAYWQPPESDAYREKFDPNKNQGGADADKFRARGEEYRRQDPGTDRGPQDEHVHRPEADHE
jgi:hypothetical protein